MRLIDADELLDFINRVTGIPYHENLLDMEPKHTRDFYDVGKHDGQVDTFLKVKDYIENHAGDINRIVVHGKEFTEVKKGKGNERGTT